MPDWEERYAVGNTPWEKGAAHPALLAFLRREPMRGRVLAPGCGLGHDVRAIAATADEVVGLDIAPSAVRLAKMHPQIGGETFEKGDFFALRSGLRGSFDWVFEHTCFCAIAPERRADYVEAAAGALNGDGRLFAIFFLNPDIDADESGPPFGCSLPELDSLFGGSFIMEREWPATETYAGREGREWCRVFRRK